MKLLHMQNKQKKIGMILVIILLFLFIPWHCPIQSIFGIPCPGCNMTTALYYLLSGNIKASLFYQAMLLPTLGYGLLLIVFRKNKTILQVLTWIWVVAMFAYYIYRMVVIFPSIPMVYDKNCLLKNISELMKKFSLY